MAEAWHMKRFAGARFWRLGRRGMVGRVHQERAGRFHWDVGMVTRSVVLAEGYESDLQSAKQMVLAVLGVE